MNRNKQKESPFLIQIHTVSNNLSVHCGKPNQISQEQLPLADFSVRTELDFLTASSQQLIKMYLRRKEAEEEDEEEEERTEDGGNSCLQISYKLGYVQV
jgi:hypothetical protein